MNIICKHNWIDLCTKCSIHLSTLFILFIYFFIDSESPKVICREDLSVQTDEGKPTATVIWNDTFVSDNSGNVSVTCNPQSGSEFTIGHTTIICKAVDGSKNEAACSFHVNVTGKCLCTNHSKLKF